MEMKHRGMYIARQLSFKDVTFKVDEVSLSKDFIKVYDDSVKLWVQLLQSFTEAAELVNAEQRMRKTMWAQFWSAHQRFFKYLCIAAKVRHAVKVASDAVKCGKCVVIGLQSTGEARTLEQIENEGELSDFVSTAKGQRRFNNSLNLSFFLSYINHALLAIDTSSIVISTFFPRYLCCRVCCGKACYFLSKFTRALVVTRLVCWCNNFW